MIQSLPRPLPTQLHLLLPLQLLLQCPLQLLLHHCQLPPSPAHGEVKAAVGGARGAGDAPASRAAATCTRPYKSTSTMVLVELYHGTVDCLLARQPDGPAIRSCGGSGWTTVAPGAAAAPTHRAR